MPTAYRYDPYSKVLTSEAYDTVTMKSIRWKAIQSARHAKVNRLGQESYVHVTHTTLLINYSSKTLSGL